MIQNGNNFIIDIINCHNLSNYLGGLDYVNC